ncbi:hypothetical protein [uncultured Methylophaga sp.]|uniref:hypothetical protein n=1 Tax=uncultured Methylophaga sp. TaxID=285271 RepID=UPI0030DCAC47|tara:strand:+ start:2082 stop:2615 length:534 start_codon:yes stop_codon:yes gene_type:complete
MHHMLEADYGLGPLSDVEHTVRAGLDKLIERNKKEPWFDGLWMNEYGEVLFGSLLVACQAYCVGCLADINKIRENLGLKALGKIEAYRSHCSSRNNFSAIEFINAAANYFKHRDEWGAMWPNNLTSQTLAAYSVTSESEFPLNKVQEIIENELGYTKLCDLVSGWRDELIKKTKKES